MMAFFLMARPWNLWTFLFSGSRPRVLYGSCGVCVGFYRFYLRICWELSRGLGHLGFIYAWLQLPSDLAACKLQLWGKTYTLFCRVWRCSGLPHRTFDPKFLNYYKQYVRLDWGILHMIQGMLRSDWLTKHKEGCSDWENWMLDPLPGELAQRLAHMIGLHKKK